MGTKVFAVRIGDKYGQDVEDYINSKIPNVTWIRDEVDGMQLQWNKLRVMNLDIDDPVLVIDIDMLFINDYMEAIEYPIERGEFLTYRSWWGDSCIKHELNGGFQKYYPKECKYIYDEFMSDPDWWSRHFIEIGATVGPVNGEQFFVEKMVRQKLKMKFLPDQWVCRMTKDPSKDFLLSINSKYKGDYAFLDNEYNSEIKIIHFMNSDFHLESLVDFL